MKAESESANVTQKRISRSLELPSSEEDNNNPPDTEIRSTNGKKSQEWAFRTNQVLLNQHAKERKIEVLIDRNQHPGQFDDKVLQSEEVSLADENEPIVIQQDKGKLMENRSDFLLLEQFKNQQISKPIYFNVIVVGASGTGKSCFIDAFLNRKFQENRVIRESTTKITYHQATRTEHNLNFQICMIDTPGYKEDNYHSYSALVKHQITSKFGKCNKQKQDRKIIIQNKPVKDEKIHCCLYFIGGPRISDVDCNIMLELQKYINIIPILSRGDCYTVEEIKQMKKQLLLQKQQKKLVWFECEELLRSRNPNKVKDLMEGVFGPAPPFLMVTCAKRLLVNNNIIYGRKYNWGICNIQNPLHCDFMLLYSLLVVYFSLPLIKLTTMNENQYLQSNEKVLSLKKTNKTIMTGIAVSLASVCLYRWFHKHGS